MVGPAGGGATGAAAGGAQKRLMGRRRWRTALSLADRGAARDEEAGRAPLQERARQPTSMAGTAGRLRRCHRHGTVQSTPYGGLYHQRRDGDQGRATLGGGGREHVGR